MCVGSDPNSPAQFCAVFDDSGSLFSTWPLGASCQRVGSLCPDPTAYSPAPLDTLWAGCVACTLVLPTTIAPETTTTTTASSTLSSTRRPATTTTTRLDSYLTTGTTSTIAIWLPIVICLFVLGLVLIVVGQRLYLKRGYRVPMKATQVHDRDDDIFVVLADENAESLPDSRTYD